MTFLKMSLVTVGMMLVAGCSGSSAEGDETSDDALSGSPNAAAATQKAAGPQSWADAYRCDDASAFKMRGSGPYMTMPSDIAKPGSAAAQDGQSLYTAYNVGAPYQGRLVWDWTTKVNGPQGRKHFVVVAAQIGMIVRFQVSATTDKAAAIVQVYDETGALVMSGIGHGGDLSPQEPALVDASAYSPQNALRIDYIDWQEQPKLLAEWARSFPQRLAAPVARKACAR